MTAVRGREEPWDRRKKEESVEGRSGGENVEEFAFDGRRGFQGGREGEER